MRGFALAASGLLAMLAGACDGPPEAPPAQPPGWKDQVRLPEATDLDPSPDIVEVNLDARVEQLEVRPGLTTPVWTYNGMLPGPLIRARAGNRVIVHFSNHLPEDTTIHWHGVRLTADMDGVPDHSQPPVPPGGTFDYSFVVPDASLFWYHPHVRSAVQVGDGLYGPLLVEEAAGGAGGDHAALNAVDQLELVLSDIDIADDGSLSDPAAGGDIATLFGREGNVLLVNGRVKPTVLARRGMLQRWRIVNAAKARYYQLALAGHTFTRIGGDGGLMPAPVSSDKVLIIPGGRADVLVVPDAPAGTTLPVRWVAYDRGFGTAYNRPDEDVFYLNIVGHRVASTALLHNPPVIPPIDVTGATLRDISLTQSAGTAQLELGINGVPSWNAEPLHANVGETDVWTITNAMDWDHPFHLHGFFFQEVDLVTGMPVPSAEWRDTYNVPAMHTVQIAVHYDDRPGMWMFHCHILDHADAGMMGMLMLH